MLLSVPQDAACVYAHSYRMTVSFLLNYNVEARSNTEYVGYRHLQTHYVRMTSSTF